MNRKDFGKLLSQLHDNLRTEIESLKGDITSTKRLKASLEKYFKQCEDLIAKISDKDTGIEAYYELAKSVKADIDSVKASADTNLQSITQSLASVQSNVQEMEEAYEAFTEINDQVTDEKTGLQAIQARVASIEAAIATSKASADTNLQSITQSLASVQSNVQEMEEAYEAFTEINDQVTDEKTGLQALYDNAVETRDEIVAVKVNADTLYKEVRKFRDNASSYLQEMGDLKEEADTALVDIRSRHDESNELKDKILQMFNIGSRSIQSNYFAERRNQLFWISIGWLVIFFLLLAATITLAIIYILPLTRVLNDPKINIGIEVFLIRLSIVSPTFFAALFALKQFGNERRLYEKYAFKAISVYSAEASVSTLTDGLSGHTSDTKDQQIVDFAINIYKNIYVEPVENVQNKWTLKGGNKLLDLTAEVNESVGDIKKDVDKLVDDLPKAGD